MRTTLLAVAAAFGVVLLVGPAWGEPPYYRKQGSWAQTLIAAREGLVQHEARVASEPRPPAGRPADEAWTPWSAAGPFQAKGKRSFAEPFPPEQGERGAVDVARSAGEHKWVSRPEWDDGVVHQLKAPGDSAIYLYRTVTVKAPKTIDGYFGSDDGMAFFLNGRKLISRDVPRGVAPNSDTCKLELAAGVNHLLFKVYNGGGDCGFYFSTSPKPLKDRSPHAKAVEELWRLVLRDFRDPASARELAREQRDPIWAAEWTAGDLRPLAARYAAATPGPTATQARALAKEAKDFAALDAVRKLYHRAKDVEETYARWKDFNGDSLKLAIQDLIKTYGAAYPKGPEYLARVDAAAAAVADATRSGDFENFAAATKAFDTLRQEALFSSPLFDFDQLLLVTRDPRQMGLPQNWQGNCAVPRTNYDNAIAVLSPVRPDGRLTTLYKPAKGEFVGDVDLHWNADRMLFSMPATVAGNKNGRWQVFEMKLAGEPASARGSLRQVTPGEEPDVDNYDPCYLPDGGILYASTAAFHGVPCVGGGNTVANLFRLEKDGKTIRQLCFDQDHNWCPTVLNDGRVMYSRWEYSDTAHYFTRILFRMNPDGTGQMEHYGSNSYWPNSIFYARPIPGHPTKVVAVISGHHGVPRMGELVVFDPGRSGREAAGAVQRIPGHAKAVDPVIRDTLVDASWPKFLHPYPLNERFFLVSMQPSAGAPWGIYLADVYDNLVPLLEVPGYACLEPLPVKKRPAPPVVPDRVKPDSREATVYVSDVYAGPGLAGVPRGTVKKLRVYEPHYAYPRMGGHINIGVDGPWDARRIHGTVPVYDDGSASFVVPANTPLAVQPLDEQGRALQVMRSWFTAMPGEQLSCVGCHEQQSASPPTRPTIAYTKAPDPITPWRGPVRGFSFKREVQPVLDKYCVGCHDGKNGAGSPPASATNNWQLATPDFAAKPEPGWRNFTPSYLALHPFVRRPGPESDYHLQKPLEWHASTSELVQILRKGHHNVKLDAEAWDRLYTWIDLNVPDHGTWSEHRKVAGDLHERRLAMRTKYANRPEDPEAIPDLKLPPVAFVKPEAEGPAKPDNLTVPGWPFDAAEAQKRQAAAGLPAKVKLDLGDGVSMDLALIPAGSFVMGDASGFPDERPRAAVKIARPFYLATYEVTNAQYAQFDPAHDSRVISVFNKDQGGPGEVANRPTQPVIRVSWQRAMAYCEWLSKKTGRKFTLPTEAQWEYACRAGTATPLSFGPPATDFSKFANLADQRLLSLCRGDSPKWIPATEFNDGAVVTESVGKYAANAWGLHDMHGNAAEWTRSAYRPYPYDPADGRDDPAAAGGAGEKVVRGGSFYDRPHRAASSFRQAYPAWQPVFNVGFRVACEADGPAVAER